MSRRLAAALVAAACFVGAAAPCRAQEPAVTADNHKAAQDAHRRALQLFDRGEHGLALTEFRRAYALAPSFRILYNIALSCVALGDSRGALEAFAGYLRDGGARIPEPRRAEVQAELTRLSKQLAGLSVDVQEAGAELSVDGETLGKGPLVRQLRLNAGRHSVELRSADGALKTQSITLEPGEERQLQFGAAGAPVQSTSSPPAAPPVSTTAGSQRRNIPWLAWGVTGALGATAAVTGALALGARSDEREAQRRRGVKSDDLSAARDKVETLALATDVLLAGTALAAGLSLYLTLRPARGSEGQTAIVVAPGQITLRRSF
jgi:hypothetical protein